MIFADTNNRDGFLTQKQGFVFDTRVWQKNTLFEILAPTFLRTNSMEKYKKIFKPDWKFLTPTENLSTLFEGIFWIIPLSKNTNEKHFARIRPFSLIFGRSKMRVFCENSLYAVLPKWGLVRKNAYNQCFDSSGRSKKWCWFRNSLQTLAENIPKQWIG